MWVKSEHVVKALTTKTLGQWSTAYSLPSLLKSFKHSLTNPLSQPHPGTLDGGVLLARADFSTQYLINLMIRVGQSHRASFWVRYLDSTCSRPQPSSFFNDGSGVRSPRKDVLWTAYAQISFLPFSLTLSLLAKSTNKAWCVQICQGHCWGKLKLR